MIHYLGRRLLGFAVSAWVAALAVFVVLDVVPGDPALLILGTEAQPDTLAALRAQMGLDRPAAERFVRWSGGLLRGDFGTSHTYNRPVASLVAERLAVTLPLALLALALAVGVGVPLGVWAAARRGGIADGMVRGFGRLGVAVPNFWIAMLLIWVFSVALGWLPAGGFPGWTAGAGPALAALILPAVALAVPEAAILVRLTRAAVLDTLREDYVRTATAKGVGRRVVLRRHVLPNALIPITTLVGLQFGFLVAGVVVVENVSTLPGLGRLLTQAIGQRDVTVVQGVVLLLAVLVMAVSALVDALHAVLDPRPRRAA